MLYINPATVHSLPRELAFAIREHVAERVHVQRRLQRAGWRPLQQHAPTAAGPSGGGGDGLRVRRLPRALALAGRQLVAERVHVQRRLQRAGRRTVRPGDDDGVDDSRAYD